MKKFLIYIVLVVVGSVVGLEMVTRAFQLSGITVPTENINGNYMKKPGMEGTWVKGGLGEIKSHYKINNLGFNSIKDYNDERRNQDKIKVAIIGDSYIEGFQNNVENSIGRLLEEMTNSAVVVDEYGMSSANIIDSGLAYEQWVKNNYDYTFVFIHDNILTQNEGAYMGKGYKVPKESFSRSIYNNLSFLRYLNINHGLGVKLSKLFFDEPESIGRIHNSNEEVNDEDFLNKINREAVKRFDPSVVFLYEKDDLRKAFIEWVPNRCLEIKPVYQPKDNGFDKHWNLNGRKNCALAIKKMIEEDSFDYKNNIQ